jgi:hypothetical protein
MRSCVARHFSAEIKVQFSLFGALQRNMMPGELFFLPSLVFSRFDLM